LLKFVIMDPGSVKIYTTGNPPRLRYIAGLLLTDILGLSWEIVTDRRKLGKHPIINYSDESVPGSFKMQPYGILTETGIRKHEIMVSSWKGLPVFFQSGEAEDFPFDIFAASFYLVSRYEEYQEVNHDKYGRFRPVDSLAYRNGFLKLPVVELWAKAFANALVRKFQYLAFKRGDYKAIITVDVDEAFRYVGKGVYRNVMGFFKDLVSGVSGAGVRFNCLAKGAKDPYEVFDYILTTIGKKDYLTRFFIPVGNPSKMDDNPSWKNEKYRQLVKRIATVHLTGIHPSFYAATDLSRLRKEIQRLDLILGQSTRLSRFHYLRIRFPGSYKYLAEAGIMEDYSMGYSDEPGFRAGISRPFRFYNLADDNSSDLIITPFGFMDAMFYGENKNDPGKAMEIIGDLIRETRRAGGTFSTIWHNTTLLETDEGRRWRNVFEFMLESQKA
jgi:hypothetical protein